MKLTKKTGLYFDRLFAAGLAFLCCGCVFLGMFAAYDLDPWVAIWFFFLAPTLGVAGLKVSGAASADLVLLCIEEAAERQRRTAEQHDVEIATAQKEDKLRKTYFIKMWN